MKTLQDVLDYLADHPRVSLICPDGRVTLAEGAHRFDGTSSGVMWFVGSDRARHYLPFDPRWGGGLHVRVRPDGLDVTWHGATVHLRFLADEPLSSGRGGSMFRDLASDMARNWEMPGKG